MPRNPNKTYSYHWTFTSFNLSPPVFDPIRMKYLCYSPEQCPTTNRMHFQGFVTMKTSSCKENIQSIPNLANQHVEPMYKDSSPVECRRYCGAEAYDHPKTGKHKDRNEQFQEFGKLPRGATQSKSDRDQALQSYFETHSKPSVGELIELGFYSSSIIKSAEIVLKYKEPVRNWRPIVNWYYGGSGVGKTYTATRDFDGQSYYNFSDDNGWWDGYDAHDNVLIDDIRPEMLTFRKLLNILDEYPCTVKVKGSMRQFLARRVNITSIYPPDILYRDICKASNPPEPIEQLLRRIDNIILVKPQSGNIPYSEPDIVIESDEEN